MATTRTNDRHCDWLALMAIDHDSLAGKHETNEFIGRILRQMYYFMDATKRPLAMEGDMPVDI